MSNENLTQTTHKNGTAPERAYRRRSFAPPVDVYENADEILIVADIPGVSAEDISLQVEKDTLTLTAKGKSLHSENARALALELAEVDYERTFRLPPGIDGDRIAAEAQRGTLLVHLPKAPEANPRKVLVKG
jgi:HSP20 family molecular chaperone IbpA